MCGIAGIFHYAEPDRTVDRDLLVRMTRALAHRGPDGEGFHVEKNVGFGHRRLAIVDLTPSGAQPMITTDGTCWITYNGESYNHSDFRNRLVSRGQQFRGTSDTETLLYLMQSEGPQRLADVAGIFAFGFWDGRDQSLTLARDHLGVKQLYFHDDGRRIVFASEIKALLTCPDVPRQPDPEAINQYLHFHTALFDSTFFKGIRQLRPGEYMRVSRYGARVVRYWNVTDFEKASERAPALLEELRSQLSHIVRDQLMSDVPVGAFFSGGIDSSAVAAYAAATGKKPTCFGVHFSDQGVVDERPYQEAAANALGLELRLITMDGSTFPEDFRKLMYHQDEPVIGSALFPMSKVSALASQEVKVCLGGQAADEIFGGYARYALGHPLHVIRSWFSGRQQSAGSQPCHGARVGGNLSRQFTLRTARRLSRNISTAFDWEGRYFEHFAQTPEASWSRVFASSDFYDRGECRKIFHETVLRSRAVDPVDKIMHWDLQTYLPGLFHQDDRMSMAASLESRVPFADPRLVQFAFKVRPDHKLRAGASKWLLRQAVSDVLPALVLNRRKVGFDTPAEQWMNRLHRDFVRDTLLSTAARQRGFWNAGEIEAILDHRVTPPSFDVLWKVFSIEMWASVFLDGVRVTPQEIRSAPPHSDADPVITSSRNERFTTKARNFVRECRDLGIQGTVARSLWEIKTRIAFSDTNDGKGIENPIELPKRVRLPFAEPAAVVDAIRPLLGPEFIGRLEQEAREATRGRILCFGRWVGDFGNPIDWHRDPVSGKRWRPDLLSSKVLRGQKKPGEIKFIWEAGRFPHAFTMAREAAFNPAAGPDLAASLYSQIGGFLQSNPRGFGIHWNSGQEIALRVLTWLFGLHTLLRALPLPEKLEQNLSINIFESGARIAGHIEYSRDSVYNNHVLSEALGLLVIGRLFSEASVARTWAKQGFELLQEQAPRQIYPDGAYINQSHNYHRGAMQVYLWAAAFVRANGDTPPQEWLTAMERSLDFLYAHQNPEDGRLPNYGSNDGSHPLDITSCDFSDFRPSLQALSVATRGERIYGSGPWDEMTAWLFGPEALNVPQRNVSRASISFAHTGYHVLRGQDPANFVAFRCGTIRERFSQIDMLHVDVWRRGQNVLTDAGSYLYNGPERWHDHFMRTGAHNTVKLDDKDQMLHYRQFKTLYWTKAKLLDFDDHAEWTICAGEHYGYRRHSGGCTHRRAVLYLKDDLIVVADTIFGKGVHNARLHWLGGDFPHAFDAENCRLILTTAHGPFSITVLDRFSKAWVGDVRSGVEVPARGWLSRYYGEKLPVPSFAVQTEEALPLTFITLMGPDVPRSAASDDVWTISANKLTVQFRLSEGMFNGVTVRPAPIAEPTFAL